MTAVGSGPLVHIVKTGVANTASVRVAFRRLGCPTKFVTSPEEIHTAEFVVLPGVGAFASAMTRLRSTDAVDALRRRVTKDRPTLAICLGMQLLGSASDESPGEEGLWVVSSRASRFDESVRVPHMGWSRIEADASCRLLQSGDAYFANSYRWVDGPRSGASGASGEHSGEHSGGRSGEPSGEYWAAATASHGGSFVAAVERGAVLGCQFHPELSGEFGALLLRRWLQSGRPRNGGMKW